MKRFFETIGITILAMLVGIIILLFVFILPPATVNFFANAFSLGDGMFFAISLFLSFVNVGVLVYIQMRLEGEEN